jgi:hypothetical protein
VHQQDQRSADYRIRYQSSQIHPTTIRSFEPAVQQKRLQYRPTEWLQYRPTESGIGAIRTAMYLIVLQRYGAFLLVFFVHQYNTNMMTAKRKKPRLYPVNFAFLVN